MIDVCVHGLGTVGLPLAAVLARSNRVHGVEPSADRRSAVTDPDRPFDEPGLRDAVQAGLHGGRLTVGPEPVTALVHLLCLPTPLRPGPPPAADVSALFEALEAMAPILRADDLVCVESTVPPGTVRALAERGPPEVLWAATPERLLPGRALNELGCVDRVVGGLTPVATERAAAFYTRALGVRVHRTDAVSATVAKLAENAARDVQIALANELSALATAAGADPRAVLTLARTHPRVDLLEPGIGVGGHCLPVDPWFLVQTSPGHATLLPAARAANEAATQRALAAIRRRADALENPLVACMGATYKPGTADTRNSPALAIARALHAEGRHVLLSDPFVPEDAILECTDAEQAVDRADLVVFLVAHPAFRALELPRPEAVLDLCGARP